MAKFVEDTYRRQLEKLIDDHGWMQLFRVAHKIARNEFDVASAEYKETNDPHYFLKAKTYHQLEQHLDKILDFVRRTG